MPELPEVENVVRGLRRYLLRLEFSDVEVRLDKCVEGSKKRFIRILRGRKIMGVERRGKNIIFRLTGDWALLVHLRMTGRLLILPQEALPQKHTHVILSFRNHPFQLRFVDARQFGRMLLEEVRFDDSPNSLAHLGPEPLEISAKEFIRQVQAKKRAIKPLLLDQHFLAGVGNIYGDEALHQAGIHPREKANDLQENDLRRLFHRLKGLLRQAIQAGGTSVRTYVSATGAVGGFQKYLRVYGRMDQACRICGKAIVRERVGGRSSFFCPCCQPSKSGKRQNR